MNHTAIIKSILLFFFITFKMFDATILAQNIDTSKKDTSSYFRTTLVPLKTKQPKHIIEAVNLSDSTNFHVTLNSNRITIGFRGKLIRTNDISVLAKFIRDNKIAEENLKVYLKANSKTYTKRVKSVIHIFTTNGIKQFNLVTN